MGSFGFRLLSTDRSARLGEIETPHGRVRTPTFMPVGTQATVKGLTPNKCARAAPTSCSPNTYRLMLRPGAERIAALASAFAGLDVMKRAYAHAIAAGYRFYSYGDACLLFLNGNRGENGDG